MAEVMKKVLFALVMLGMLSLACAKPDKLPKGWVELPTKEVQAHLKIVTDLTRYEMPFWKRPRAIVVPDADYVILACGLWGAMTGDCGSIGIFFPATPDVVFIRQHPEIDAQEQEEVLVHELTHWLQAYWGWKADFTSCPDVAAHEVEAYTAAYMYVVRYQKRYVGFSTPDFRCLPPHADEPAGVVAEPTITKGSTP